MCVFIIVCLTIYRIKLDSNELDGSPSSTEIALIQPILPANMKTQAAFVNKLYK